MLLHTVLHNAENFTECIRLASYINDETNKFYQVNTIYKINALQHNITNLTQLTIVFSAIYPS